MPLQSQSTLNPTTTRVGIVGLGIMGGPMAAQLLRSGYSVGVFNRTVEKCRAYEDLGATVATSVRQLAADSNVLILMLADDAAVEQIVGGESGLVAGCHSGLIVINCSTVHPNTNRRLAETLAARDVKLLDAPVTGSRPQAEAGKLYFLVGGDNKTYQACIPLLDSLGRGHIYLGEVGAGSCAKLGNNLMGFINLAGLVEALQIVSRFGLKPERFMEMIANSGGRSAISDVKAPKILHEDWSPDFSLKLAAKDLRLACDLARQLDQPIPVLTKTSEVLTRAAESFGEGDVCGISRWYSSQRNPHRGSGP